MDYEYSLVKWIRIEVKIGLGIIDVFDWRSGEGIVELVWILFEA